MRTKLRRIIIMIIIGAAIFLGGCPGIWSDTGLPILKRDKIEFPVPEDGLKYSLATPSNEEEKGILLRYKPQPKKLKYNSQFIKFTGVVGDEGYKQTQKYSESVRFLPAPDGTNLIREGETKFGMVGGVRMRLLVSPRGGCLKSLEMKPIGFSGITTGLLAGDQFSSFENEASDRFPEEVVNIGQTWTQATRQQGKKSFQTSVILWRLMGFTNVRGRRCAVLKGVDMVFGVGDVVYNSISKSRSLHIMVLYFDYERGIDVESFTWGPMVKTLEAPDQIESNFESVTDFVFFQSSLAE